MAELLKVAFELLSVFLAPGAAGGKLSIHASVGKNGYNVGAGYRANVPGGKPGEYVLGHNNTVQVASARFASETEARAHFDKLCADALAAGWTARVKASGKLAGIPNAAAPAAPADKPADKPAPDAPADKPAPAVKVAGKPAPART